MISYDIILRRYGHLDGAELLKPLIHEVFPDRLALVSSFGTESAILLHMVSRIRPDLPVIFLDTGKLFGETQAYRRALVSRLGLTDVRAVTPLPDAVDTLDPKGDLWLRDNDACCALRKVEPLERALRGFQAWITGRKRFHGGERTGLTTMESVDWRLKVNPLARWTFEDVQAYFEAHGLPRHPLVDQGYLSVGCMPCTAPTDPASGVRSGRWANAGGRRKTECGIHLRPDGRTVRTIRVV